jgi:catechol 2,3-dioxygenase-like lactoylglutathione lyase family enzyme
MITSTEHFSFTVGNIDDALHFFRDLLGLEATPIAEVDDEDVRRIVGMPTARLRTSLVNIPDGNKIELIEYVQPKGERISLATCNAGVAHIAFVVDDLEKMYHDLSREGVEFVNAPVRAPGNDGKGMWDVCYFRGPDGITFELIEKQGQANPNR